MDFMIVAVIFSGSIAIALLYRSEKNEDYVEKIWSLIIGLIFVWVTICFAKIGMKNISKIRDNQLYKTEYIN